MKQKVTFKYTVENPDKYRELVEKAARTIFDGIDFYTEANKKVIYITFPEDRWTEMCPAFDELLVGEEWQAEECRTPCETILELEESVNRWHKEAVDAQKSSDRYANYWTEEHEKNGRVRSQVQAIAVLMNSIFPKED